jgi:hypothetical protein
MTMPRRLWLTRTGQFLVRYVHSSMRSNSLASRYRCATEHSSSPLSPCLLEVSDDQMSSNRFRGIPVFVPTAGAWRKGLSASVFHRCALCPNSCRVPRMRTSKSFNSSPVFYCGCLLVASLLMVSSTMRTNCPGGIIAMTKPCGHRGGMADPASSRWMILTPAAVCSVDNRRGTSPPTG